MLSGSKAEDREESEMLFHTLMETGRLGEMLGLGSLVAADNNVSAGAFG